MLIHAHPSGHVSSFSGVAHAIVSVNADGTFSTHIYVGDDLSCVACKLTPTANALDAVAANVRAAVEHVIDNEKVQAAIKASNDLMAADQAEFASRRGA